MKSVNIHEAKTHLSKLVAAAAKGEPFVICKAGKPLVKVVALDAPSPRQTRLPRLSRRPHQDTGGLRSHRREGDRTPVQRQAMNHLLVDDDNELFFGSISVWEIVIKQELGRDDFHVDARSCAALSSTMAIPNSSSRAAMRWRSRICPRCTKIRSIGCSLLNHDQRASRS